MNNLLQKKILIIDDDPDELRRLGSFLSSDYVVIEVDDSSRAIEIVKSEHPDLVLVDVMMRKVSGYSVCTQIKSSPNTKEIPVMIVTSLGTKTSKNIGKETGADEYIIRPVKPDQLYNVISRFLGWLKRRILIVGIGFEIATIEARA